MQKILNKSLFAFAALMCLSTASFAADNQDIVTGPGKQPVRGERFGNCVQTKWTAASDPCAPAPEPKQVKAEPAPAPAPAPEPVAKFVREDLTIYFDFNKSAITAASAAKLDTISDAVNRSPRVTRVGIVGYTDDIGTNAYNNKLSVQRANAVKAYLDTKMRINSNVLGLRGLGEQNPVTTGCNKIKNRKKKIACLARDRRVEIEFEFQK